MPLSEREQRLLDQLEQQLHDEDPKFAHTLAADPARTLSTRHIVVGVLTTIVGILVLLAGVSLPAIPLGVIGFVIMGAGVYYATAKRKLSPGPNGPAPSAGKKSKNGFMSNLESRWDERHKNQQ